ncbi:MAG: transporter substrate-binding domain-containing protein [Planctomycetes bacterium]|nr:transporter substrate-binding domain-containing protein [Planctomycetota bacterium]
MTFRKGIVAMALALATGLAPAAGEASPQTSPPIKERTVRAAVYVSPPFVMENAPGVYTGFSIELWEKIATLMNVKFTYEKCESITDMIQKLGSNQADIAVVNFTVTSSRLKLLDFTHPYFNTGLRIMINEDHRFGFARFFNSLHQYGFVDIFMYGGLIILVLTVIVTAVLRRVDAAFHRQWHHGLAESFYHVMSVVMTGKTNYKGAVGSLGKVFGGIWLVCGVGVVAYITSSVTSIMTANKLLHEIHGVRDLANKSVGVIEGSAANEYCESHQMFTKSFDQLPAAIDDLVAHQIQAIVADAPQLQYFDHTHPEVPVTEVGAVFNEEKYAFGLPKQSDLRHEINFELLKLQESGYLDELQRRYFGNP